MKNRRAIGNISLEHSKWEGIGPTIEMLEERRMLSTATGTAAGDTIGVNIEGGALVVRVNGNAVLNNPPSVEIYSLGGIDTITVNATVTMGIYIEGGTGNDIINGGSGDDTIFGGDGGDIINGNAGHDHLYGEFDDDEIHGGDGDDYLDGGDHVDELFGDAGDDYLEGGLGGDILHGGADDDYVFGGSGADLVYGDSGADYFGNNVDDAVDHLYGGDGSDTVSGFDYGDTMTEIEFGTD